MGMRAFRVATLSALLLPLSLYQSCLVLVPDVPGAIIIDGDDIPHFDGDDDDGFLDKIFGDDDDDDDDDHDDWWDDHDDDDWCCW
jgi:hypothetical protein